VAQFHRNYHINDSYGNADSTKKYGPLYTWEAANVSCPEGWHLPSDSDWKTLERSLGMSDFDVDKFGFSEKRGVDQKLGIRLQKGGDIGFNFVIMEADNAQETWTSSDYDDNRKIVRSFSRNDNSLYRANNGIGVGLCVRCIKD